MRPSLRVRLAGEPIAPYIFTALWALAMISVPILGWTLGEEAVRTGIILGVLLQATASLAALVTGWGVWPTLRLALLILPASWFIEFVGSKTGFPFGAYHYTDALQPQLFGVPLLIPLAWMMMLPAAWAVSELLVGRTGSRSGVLRFLAVSAVAFTAWDLFLDPQMVSWGYWEWDVAGGYFGIPWVNYGGWLLSSFLLGALVFLTGAPPPLPVTPLLVIYTVTWFLQSIGLGVFWGMPGPALVGSLAMGAFAVAAWRGLLRGEHTVGAKA